MGVGDQVPAALQQLGARVSLIDSDEMAWGDLSRYNVIVTGVRAYEERADLRANNHRLLEVRGERRNGNRSVQPDGVQSGAVRAVPGEDELGAHHRRERAGEGSRSRSSGLQRAEQDQRQRLERLGPGTRHVFPRATPRSEIRRSHRDGGSLRVQQGREAWRAGRSEATARDAGCMLASACGGSCHQAPTARIASSRISSASGVRRRQRRVPHRSRNRKQQSSADGEALLAQQRAVR